MTSNDNTQLCIKNLSVCIEGEDTFLTVMCIFRDEIHFEQIKNEGFIQCREKLQEWVSKYFFCKISCDELDIISSNFTPNNDICITF